MGALALLDMFADDREQCLNLQDVSRTSVGADLNGRLDDLAERVFDDAERFDNDIAALSLAWNAHTSAHNRMKTGDGPR
jgi:hypothetical protein